MKAPSQTSTLNVSATANYKEFQCTKLMPFWKAPKTLNLCHWVCTALSADKQPETCPSGMQGNSQLSWVFDSLTDTICARAVSRPHITTALDPPALKLPRYTSECNVASHPWNRFQQYYIKSLCLTWHWQVFKVLLQYVCKLVFLRCIFY